ncbi:unnamed protein product [Amaranthus hypochondriacus]
MNPMNKLPNIICSPWLFLLMILLYTPFISGQCLDDQKILLLQIKNNLKLDPVLGFPDELLGWNQSTECCLWSGVTCDNSTYRVIGLNLKYFNIIGGIDNSSSLFRLHFIKSLDLSNNDIKGSIPSLMGNLTLLEHLDLSGNQFSGPIPSFSLMKNLKTLDLSRNNLEGPINSTDWEKLVHLEEVDFSINSLDGSIPSSLFFLPQIRSLLLASNKFSGKLNDFSTPRKKFSSMLSSLDLAMNGFEGPIPESFFVFRNLEFLFMESNKLEGPVPESFFELKKLESVDLSSNRLNGTLNLARILLSLKNLEMLDLSHNYLLIDAHDCYANYSFSQLSFLRLASCGLRVIPECLKYNSSIEELNFSLNQISTVPSWVWGIRPNDFDLMYGIVLNLSYNHLVDLEPPMSIPNNSLGIAVLDLKSNYLQGEFPVVSPYLSLLDCSNNNFTSINPDLGNYVSKLQILSFSRNNLFGSIPTFVCNATQLVLLNLNHNHLEGTIPECLMDTSIIPMLEVLNLRGNNLSGRIPAKFNNNNYLKTLDLNGNVLQGVVPASLANCTQLMVLDVGNNHLNHTFPCHLINLSELLVLVLRSNQFHGSIFCPGTHSLWPMLQIFDLAFNHFSGELTKQILSNRTSMVAITSRVRTESLSVEYNTGFMDARGFYENTVTVTFKGNTYELAYILESFISIDCSNNAFHGELPTELGNLNALRVLNLSHNLFSGNIPSSIGNMSQIESLDLCYNALSGKIPSQLANMNFLAYLNISFNKLSGGIPTSTQLQSFNASSYEGNEGLYGPPLTPISKNDPSTSSKGSDQTSKIDIESMLKGAGVGFPVGIIVFIGPLIYIKRYREWYCKHLHYFVMKMLCKEDGVRARNKGRRRLNRG